MANQGLLSRPLLLVIPILIGLFLTRSPYMMATVAPSASKPWADGPIKLVATPQYETKKVGFSLSIGHFESRSIAYHCV